MRFRRSGWRAWAAIAIATAIVVLASGCYGPVAATQVVTTMTCVPKSGAIPLPAEERSLTIEVTAPSWANPGTSFQLGFKVIGLSPATITGQPTQGQMALAHPGLAPVTPTATTPPPSGSTSTILVPAIPPGDRAAGIDFGQGWTSVTGAKGSTATVAVTSLSFITFSGSSISYRCDPVGVAPVAARIRVGKP